MIINFDNMEEKTFFNFKGGEKEARVKMYSDENNKIMHGVLIPGASIGLHTHEANSEIVYVLEGKAKVLYDGKYEEVKAGQCHYCPKGHSHSFINDSNENVVIFAIVPEHE